MPIIGKLSDKIDKFKIFAFASVWSIVMVNIYSNLSVSPIWLVIIFNVLMMSGIMSRMVPSSALVSAIPVMQDRGAFMSINSSLQQLAGGVAAGFAGLIIVQKDRFSPLVHYNTLGLIVSIITALTIFLIYRVSKLLKLRKEESFDLQIEKVEAIHH